MLINSSKQPRKNYRNRSFKNQNLTGADFSFADIRGADFTGANLTGANFNYALAGLTKSQIIRLFVITFILFVATFVVLSAIQDWSIRYTLPDGIPLNHFGLVILMFLQFLNISLLVITIRQGIVETIKYFFYLISLLTLTIPILVSWRIIKNIVDNIFRLFGILEAPNLLLWLSRELRILIENTVMKSLNPLLEINGNDNFFLSQVGSLIVIMLLMFALISIFSVAVVLAEIIAEKWLKNRAVVVILVLNTLAWIMHKVYAHRHRQWITILLHIPICFTLILIAKHLTKKILEEDEKNLFFLRLGVAIATIGGTNFKNANLTDADFSHAILKSTNFRFANTTRTLWRQAKYLKFARVEDTILEDIKVRELLITGDGKNQTYIGANLRGANLTSADLNNANLKLAELSEASLQTACLNNANLTEASAISTNFTSAQMSGTCLEGWNIDHTTILDNIESKYIYLLEEPKPETDDRERRPSSGYFQEGDFTKLFTEVLNTVDLIFRDGVDAKAFMSSFQQVKVENQGIPMKIRGMENKGDGVVLIRIDVPPEIEKEKIHRELMQFYDENVRMLEEKYQQELGEIKKLVNLNLEESDRKYQIELAQREKQITRAEERKKYMMSLVNQIFQKPTSTNYLVTLNFEGGSFEMGFPVIRANIWLDSHPLPISVTGNLPPNFKFPQLYQDWSQKYEQLRECYRKLDLLPRIKMKKDQITNFSQKDIDKEVEEIISQIRELEKEWRSLLNNWLNNPSFNKIEKELRTRFNPSDKVRLIIQSGDILMQYLPWHLWNFFSDYQFAETAIALPEANRVEKLNIAREKVRILAIFGNDQGLNLKVDEKSLLTLGNQAEIIFLVQPDREKLDEKLWDEKGWDIICFSGHSESEPDGSTGCLDLGNETKMTIEELEHALTTAISRGLKLAIFNSCDGLGLARQFAQLYIPAIIVMREPVPDVVAQQFFQNFLQLFASGKSLYISMGQAREKLQGIEDKFPGATWLPIICQNPAEVPPSWEKLHGISRHNLGETLTDLQLALETETWLTPVDKKAALQQVEILTEVGEFPRGKNQDFVKSAIIILRDIVAEYPAATLINETVEKLLFIYSKIQNFEPEKESLKLPRIKILG